MTMTINEFQALSTRTAPFNAKPSCDVELWNVLSNYSVGLVGEHIEYELELSKVELYKEDIPNELMDSIESEIGDVMHYAVNLLTILDIEFDKEDLYKDISGEELKNALKDVLEIHKKYVYHGHEFKKEEFIEALYIVISQFTIHFEEGLGLILEKNIEKLKKRYPGEFNSQDSIERKDVK